MKSHTFMVCALLGVASARPQPQQFVVTTIAPPNTDEITENDLAGPQEIPEAPPEPPSISQFHVTSNIQFRYAHTVVETYFKNPAAVAGKATFSLVMPEKAFISNFSMLIEGQEFVARVESKEDAKEAFEAAVTAGQGAGLVEQDVRDANQITVSANVEPRGKVRFRLTYEELLERKNQRYEHAVFVNPGQVVADFQIEMFINESLPLHDVLVPELQEDANIIPDKKKKNPDAVLTLDPVDNTKAHVLYRPDSQKQKAMSDKGVAGKFSVEYDVDRKDDGNEVQVIDGYFVHFYAPDKLETLPKHIVFVLDVSGSMYGEKLQQTKDAMVTIIDALTEQDSFNILTFSDEVYHWVPEAEKLKEGNHSVTYRGDEDTRTEALKYVLNLNTIGGTNINQGILDALEQVRIVKQEEVLTSDTKPIVIFLTDGQATSGVTMKEAIKKNVADANKDLKVPIYSLAFGRGADFNLVKMISKDNHAFARKIYEGSDASLQLEDFYAEIASPILDDLDIVYTGELVNKSSITKTNPRSFNKGSEIIIAGRLKDPENREDGGKELIDVMIGAQAKGGTYHKNFRICVPYPISFETNPLLKTEEDVVTEVDELPSQISPFPEPVPLPQPIWPDRCVPLPPKPVEPKSDAQNFVERLWAFLTIKDLLDEKPSKLEERKEELTEDDDKDADDEVPSLDDPKALPSSEDPEFPVTKAMTDREKALELALKYNFVTELTSLVVVRPNMTSDEKEILEPEPVATGGSGSRGGGCPNCFGLSSHQRAAAPPMLMSIPSPPRMVPRGSSGGGASGGFGGLRTTLVNTFGSRSTTMKQRKPARTTTTTPPNYPMYDAVFDSEDDYDDVFGDGLEKEATTSAPKTSCSGNITLYSMTRLRGLNVTLLVDDLDLSQDNAFNNKLTSLEVQGDCCWKLFTEPNHSGESKTFTEGEYKSAVDMGSLFREASSVQRLLEC